MWTFFLFAFHFSHSFGYNHYYFFLFTYIDPVLPALIFFSAMDSPGSKGSTIDSRSPLSISSLSPSLPDPLEEFRDTANAALKRRFFSAPYDDVQVILLNWNPKANDLGPQIFNETKELHRVFRDEYHFETKHHLIPSRNPGIKVQKWLSDIIYDLSEKKITQKKILLIVYYI
jgi:hypothetical protein